jgi:uncharacterized membrane protein required for colicin V production
MDVLLVGFIGGFIYAGWRTGFLHRLIGIVFLLLSFVLSAYFRYPVGAVASTFFKDIPPDYANLVGYTIAFPVVLAVLHLGSRAFLGKVSVSGITKELDQGLGAVIGGLEAILILSAAIVILDTYFGTSSSLGKTAAPGGLKELTQALNASTTAQLLRGSTVPLVLAVLGPLLPKDVSTILPGGLPTRLPFPAR